MSAFGGPNIITDGLVLNLDAGNIKSYPESGTTWFDKSGNGNDGTLTNGPTFDSGSLGSIVFDGVDDYVTGSNSDNFAFGTGDFTVMYWMYINAFSGTGTPTFVDLRTNTSNGYSDYVQNNQFKLYWDSGDRYISTGSILAGSWYNVAVARQSTTVSVYFNGSLDGTVSNSYNLTGNGFRVARNINTAGTSYLNGKISSVLIYKGKALSPQEVTQNYNATKTRFGL